MSLDWILLGLRVLGTVILYTFLGLAFYVIWRDLKQAEAQTSARSQISDRLRVIAVAEGQSLIVGDVLPLQSTTLLGYGPESKIVVNDATSTNQARLSRKNGVWWLENLDSQNGAKLNNLPLSKPTSLAHGDVIEIGHVCFKLEMAME